MFLFFLGKYPEADLFIILVIMYEMKVLQIDFLVYGFLIHFLDFFFFLWASLYFW